MMNGSNNQNDNGMIHPENGGINPHRNVEMDGNHEHAEAVEVDAEPIPDVQWIGPRAHPVLVENYFSVVQHAQRVTLMEQEMSSSSDDGTCFREPAQIVNPEDNSNLSDTLGTGTSSRSDTMHPPSPMEIESFQQPSSSRLNNSLQVSNVFEAFARVASAQSDQAGSSSQDQSSAPSTQTEASGSGQSSTQSGQAATSGTQAIEELRFRYRDDATTIQLLSLEGEGESDGTVSIPVTDEAMFAPRYVLSPNSVERNPMLASLLEKNDNFPDDVVLEGDKGDLYEALLKKHEEAKQVDNSIPREQPLEKGSTIFMESGMTHFRHCDITKTRPGFKEVKIFYCHICNPLACQFCWRLLLSQEYWHRHQDDVRRTFINPRAFGTTPRSVYTCRACDIGYSKYQHLIDHVKNHEETPQVPFRCIGCKRTPRERRDMEEEGPLDLSMKF